MKYNQKNPNNQIMIFSQSFAAGKTKKAVAGKVS